MNCFEADLKIYGCIKTTHVGFVIGQQGVNLKVNDCYIGVRAFVRRFHFQLNEKKRQKV